MTLLVQWRFNFSLLSYNIVGHARIYVMTLTSPPPVSHQTLDRMGVCDG